MGVIAQWKSIGSFCRRPWFIPDSTTFLLFPLSFQRSLNCNNTDYLSLSGSLLVFGPREPHTSSSNQQQIECYIPRPGGRSVYASGMRYVF